MGKQMKYNAVFIFLLVFSFSKLSSQELFIQKDKSYLHYGHEYFNYTVDWSLKFIFPIYENYPLILGDLSPENHPLILGDLSAGIGYEIIPNLFLIGVAGDVGIGVGWLSLFYGLSSENNEKDRSDNEKYKNDDEIAYNLFALSLGARIYNIMKINKISIINFLVYDFQFIILPMPYIGIDIFYKKIGIEYAYYLPTKRYSNTMLHQLSLKCNISNSIN
jgi:hypothetical protein